jgi:uncharacterized protein
MRSKKLKQKKFLIGVISDTHGLLRPEAQKSLIGTNIIIHAGDIGNVEIIRNLEKITPVKAIRGNIDREKWSDEFTETLNLKFEGKKIFVIHNIKDLHFIPEEKDYEIIISGHSHKPSIKNENGILYLNPGSAGKRRFNLPVSTAQIKIVDDKISVKIIELKI